MKVKLVNPDHAVGMIDPHSKRTPFIDAATNAVIAIADVPETSFWVRRVLAGELERVGDAPVGNEPIQTLTTRS